MKKLILFTFLLILINNCNSNQNNKKFNIKGLTNEIYNKLCGVWVFDKNGKIYIDKFSWGETKYKVNYSKVIDFGSNPPKIYEFGFTVNIKEIKEINKNSYRLKVNDSANKKLEGEVIININDDGTIWFDKSRFSTASLKENKLYKIGGPDIKFIKYYKVRLNKLYLREEPSQNSKIVRELLKDEKVEALEWYNVETIKGIKDIWIRVKTERKNEYGWCFETDLEELND